MNLQKVAGGKKFLELLLEAVNFTSYGLIRRTLPMIEPVLNFGEFFEKNLLRLQHTGFAMR